MEEYVRTTREISRVPALLVLQESFVKKVGSVLRDWIQSSLKELTECGTILKAMKVFRGKTDTSTTYMKTKENIYPHPRWLHSALSFCDHK